MAGREARWGLWWALRMPVGQRKAVNYIRNDKSQGTWMAASLLVLHGCHHMPALWVTFLPSVTVDRFTFPALEEDVIYDDVPCESPDAHQPGMASCGSFSGLSLGQGRRAMLGMVGLFPSFCPQCSLSPPFTP